MYYLQTTVDVVILYGYEKLSINLYICLMKYLSFIVAFLVLVLSTAPCCIEDKCNKPAHQISQKQQQGDNDSCAKCCSPFMNCNTCMGFVITYFQFSTIHLVSQTENKIALCFTTPTSDFPDSLWHPPQFLNM